MFVENLNNILVEDLIEFGIYFFIKQ